MRTHSYQARGFYSKQLGNLLKHFPRERVLVLFTRDLLNTHDAVFQRVCIFLGVADSAVKQTMVREGNYRGKKHRLAAAT